MPFDLKLPHVHPSMTGAIIECVYATAGTRLASGSKLLDISVNLGGAFAQECPPITYYRLVLRETLWLSKMEAEAGMQWDMDTPLAIFTAQPDEPIAGPSARQVRIATAGIIYHSGMWSGSIN